MKRGFLYVTAALLLSLAIPEVWANGPGGRGGCGGRGGWGGGGGCHGGWGRGGPGCGRFGPRCGFRGGWGGWNGGGNVINGGFGGYGYACGFGGYGCATPYSGYGCGTGVTPANYYINYSPTITTGAVAPATLPAPGVVAESTSCSVMASGDLVGNVQRALRARGYYNGPIDGMAGAPTRAAIRAYAAKCGLPATGVIDGQLLTSLGLM